MDQFPKNIEEITRRSAAIPKKFEIDLSIALTDQPYHISGNVFYVFSAPDESSYIDIKVNETREPAISFSVHTGLLTPFDLLFITTPAGQAGTLVLLYGTESPHLLQFIDNRSTTVAGVGGLLDELRGDITPEIWGTEITVGNAVAVEILAANANRKACIVQAKSANAGKVYIGFDDTVTTTKWIAELQAGQAFSVDDYRGAIFVRADAVGQLVGYGEW